MKKFFVVCTLFFVVLHVHAQMNIPRVIWSDSTSSSSNLIPSNSVTYMRYEPGNLWTGTSKGLARTSDFGNTWQSFRDNPKFPHNGIFALATSGNIIWTSTGYDTEIEGGSVQTGGGYTFSLDNGLSWDYTAQTVDDPTKFYYSYGINDSVWMLPVTVPQQNVTFDISITPSGTVYIASWSSSLRRTYDNGATWERIFLPLDNMMSITPDDTLWTYAASDTNHQQRIFARYDPRQNFNMLAFSVFAVDDYTIWCGTAGGVNKSTDGGISWVRYTHQNQTKPILGNWVIAIDEQRINGNSRIWTTNWRANDNEEDYGVSYTDDGGLSWTNLLHGVKAYDFAFKDSIVYIATDNGIFRTEDLGETFQQFSNFIDVAPRTFIRSPKVYSVVVVDDTVFIGTDNGLVKTTDNATHAFGETWKTYRTYQRGTYAYPNPFSPSLDDIVNIHYDEKDFSSTNSREVSIEIFDFAMNRVRTLVTKAVRSEAYAFDERWDGRTDGGELVPNGVYFYRLVIDNDEPQFGKILVL